MRRDFKYGYGNRCHTPMNRFLTAKGESFESCQRSFGRMEEVPSGRDNHNVNFLSSFQVKTGPPHEASTSVQRTHQAGLGKQALSSSKKDRHHRNQSCISPLSAWGFGSGRDPPQLFVRRSHDGTHHNHTKKKSMNPLAQLLRTVSPHYYHA